MTKKTVRAGQAKRKTARRKAARARAKTKGPATKAGSARAAGRARRPKRFVYFFGNGKADGDRTMRDVLGGKGAGLAEMTNAGLPVPPGLSLIHI